MPGPASSTDSGDLASNSVMNSLATPAGLQALLNIFKGTPGSTTTQTNNVSLATQQALLQQDLIGSGSAQGLAAIAQGQKTAGMYNSTVNEMLTNQLLAKSASDVAALSSSRTTTTTGTPQLSGSTALGTLGTILAGSLVNKLTNGAITGAGNMLSDALGLGGSAFGANEVGKLLSDNSDSVAAAVPGITDAALASARQKSSDQFMDSLNDNSNDPFAAIDNAINNDDQRKKRSDTVTEGTVDTNTGTNNGNSNPVAAPADVSTNNVTPVALDSALAGSPAPTSAAALQPNNVQAVMSTVGTNGIADTAAVTNAVNGTTNTNAPAGGSLDLTIPSTSDTSAVTNAATGGFSQTGTAGAVSTAAASDKQYATAPDGSSPQIGNNQLPPSVWGSMSPAEQQSWITATQANITNAANSPVVRTSSPGDTTAPGSTMPNANPTFTGNNVTSNPYQNPNYTAPSSSPGTNINVNVGGGGSDNSDTGGNTGQYGGT